MRIYSKSYESKQTTNKHVAKIKEYGGQVSVEDGTFIVYYFGQPLKKGSIIIHYPIKNEFTITDVSFKNDLIEYTVLDGKQKRTFMLNSKDKIVKF